MRQTSAHWFFRYSETCPHFTAYILTVLFSIIFFNNALGQEKIIDDKVFKRYKASYFKPKKGLNYTLCFAPVLTVDPLGIGGKSTYALSAVTNVTLWESKLNAASLQGLRFKEFYTAVGYEYFPKQFDNIFASIGVRIKTFMPLALRMDGMYSFGYGLIGTSTRFCVGFEIRNIAFFATGTTSGGTIKYFGDPPSSKSKYVNVGSIMLVIPLYHHEGKSKARQ
jgi:hypothetical protein